MRIYMYRRLYLHRKLMEVHKETGSSPHKGGSRECLFVLLFFFFILDFLKLGAFYKLI